MKARAVPKLSSLSVFPPVPVFKNVSPLPSLAALRTRFNPAPIIFLSFRVISPLFNNRGLNSLQTSIPRLLTENLYGERIPTLLSHAIPEDDILQLYPVHFPVPSSSRIDHIEMRFVNRPWYTTLRDLMEIYSLSSLILSRVHQKCTNVFERDELQLEFELSRCLLKKISTIKISNIIDVSREGYSTCSNSDTSYAL